jgi:hypothetical protein
MLKSSVYFMDFKSNESLIPKEKEIYFSNIEGVKEIKYKALNISLGYTYSMVLKKYFYIIPLVFVGPCIQINEIKKKKGWEQVVSPALITNVRLTSGYNGNSFFSGILIELEKKSTNPDNIEFGSGNFFIRLSGGFRF